MMDRLRIDNHKLIYHVDRVKKWLDGESIYPIYMEISPSGACNQRCSFCAFDYLKYKVRFINTKKLLVFLSDAARLGVKSIMYAGEGEPLLHKDIKEMINYTKKVGIDTALATNGVLLDGDFSEGCLGSLSWLRFSINAGTNKTYAKIHRCKPQVFDVVIKNIETAVKIKKRKKYPCAIGIQFILLPENYKEIKRLAITLKRIGADYLTIKPFIRHPSQKSKIYNNLNYDNFIYLNENFQRLQSDDFDIYFRAHCMEKLNADRSYRKCFGLPFFAEVTSDGNMYTCGPYLGNKRFCYGNIYRNSFKEIWNGKKRKQILKMVNKKLDVAQCMKSCRLDEINKYLWELKNPPPHVNFI
ncbi:MAG: hypothetical protein AMJ78_06465 [Omnitrophica WOR_2 bacterium SM23_29]|nr:MAG: hypothetical protein AMJ78_06465 [Omnitrophica WOR_2 bacterium SM23_29]